MIAALNRIYAVILRHTIGSFRSFDKFANVVYWPFISIVIWGLTGLQSYEDGVVPSSAIQLLLAISLWQIVLRGTIEMTKGILEELLNHNLINLFSTPLRFIEWIIAVMLLGTGNLVLVMIACSFFTYSMYGVTLAYLGWQSIPLVLLLLLSSWSLGFVMITLFMCWGMRMNDFLFVVVWGIAPFSAIYASVNLLPVWAQTCAYALPFVYVFEAMREGVTTGIINHTYIFYSLLLNIGYLIASFLVLIYVFRMSKSKGLARLG